MNAHHRTAAIAATVLGLFLALGIGFAQSNSTLEFYGRDAACDEANADMTITVKWNTTSDVDLWVSEPGDVKCSYQNPSTSNGGTLHEDNTTGFGPERYTLARAPQGEFVISLNHFRAAGPTTVRVELVRYAGTPNQIIQRHTVTLQRSGQTVEVGRVRF